MVRIAVEESPDWNALYRVHDASRPRELEGSCDPRAFIPLADDPEVDGLHRSTIVVAREEGEILGFAGVEGDYLGWLYVHPDHFGRGIGRALLRAALALIPGEPWTIVLAGNRPAIRLYESEGFREVSRFEGDNAGYPITGLRLAKA